MVAQGIRTMERNFYVDARYELFQCAVCNHYYQSYVPITAYEDTYEEGQSSKNLNQKTKRNLVTENVRTVEVIGPLLQKSPYATSVLELGTGWGFWLLTAKSVGHDTIGLEVAPDRVRYARSNGLTVLVRPTELGDAQFDYIHAFHVFEHLPDPVGMLATLTQHLKPNGILFIAVPDGGQFFKRKYANDPEKIHKDIAPFEHVHCFTNHSLKVLGTRAGLRPLTTRHIFKTLFAHISTHENLHFIQEAIRIAARQHFRTAVYFQKV
jgi:2-polyprenyl-3-methyl-5-hydroxy-6-metoxy-1,4-benzoquinol methylase